MDRYHRRKFGNIDHGDQKKMNIQTNNHQQRLSNIYQGCNEFLDQLKFKDAISLINDLCQLHKIKPEFELIDVRGSDYSKIFTVYIQLGVSEKHNGEGATIKSAQQNAALNALKNTRLKFPKNNAKQFTNNRGNIPKKFNQQNFVHHYHPNNRQAIINPFIPYNAPIYHQQMIPVNFTPSNPIYHCDPYTNKHFLVYELVNPCINFPEISNNVQSSSFHQNAIPKREIQSTTKQSTCKHQNEHQIVEKSENKEITDCNPAKNQSSIDPISDLNRFAALNRYRINFIHTDSYGPAHCPVFVYRCQLFNGDNQNEKLLYESEGKDRSKKMAKKQAAQNLLLKINDQKLQPKSELKNENFDYVSNKSLTLLYDLARNMSIPSPIFNYTVLNTNNHQLTAKNFIEKLRLTTKTVQIYKIECILNFEDKFILKTIGYSLTQRLTKQIAAFIMILRLGIRPPKFDQFDDLFIESLRFSLIESNDFDTDENILKFRQNNHSIDIIYANEKDFSKDLAQKQREMLKINEKFIHFIGKNFYHYMLKEQSQQALKKINERLPFLLKNFKSKSSAKIDHLNEESLLQLLSKMDMKSSRNHLKFIQTLLMFGITDETGDDILPLIEFKHRTFEINKNATITIIHVQFNYNNLTENEIDLIAKNYITYEFGDADSDASVELASLRLLNKISSNSMKKMFDMKAAAENDQTESSNSKSNSNSKSKSSSNQQKCKLIMKKLYDLCQDLLTHKPEFIITKSSDNDEEILCKCEIKFCHQNFNEKFNGILSIETIANSKRLAKTIASYLILSLIGCQHSTEINQLNDLPYFNEYLQKSIEKNSKTMPNIKQIMNGSNESRLNITLENNQLKLLDNNLKFIENVILKNIYQSHLKNQKFTKDPSCLYERIIDSLYEYLNYHKQLDNINTDNEFKTFDNWNNIINEWIDLNILSKKFDTKKYWNHLQLLSIIGSILNSQQSLKLMEPKLFELKCQLQSIKIENNQKDGKLAIIMLQCPYDWQQLEQNQLLRKKFLSFAIDSDAENAREYASYKALRYLAINLWKTKNF
uniref:Double-stranded RNA-binding protein Staufen homolog 1 isoform X2 n=1 Tax=Psoroptes ovis TaxID=83912 RepID=A0A3B0RBU8_PSOOV|nr:double-stranded RNA-binding protein Staufen homolog 1 isoform X2 [Psoroptes ovis]